MEVKVSKYVLFIVLFLAVLLCGQTVAPPLISVTMDSMDQGVPINGDHGFQRNNNLRRDGIATTAWKDPGVNILSTQTEDTYRPTSGVSSSDDLTLLARLVSGEARGEPYSGKVAVAAVILNRMESPEFPNTLSGVIYQPLAFESVSNGQIWRGPLSSEFFEAARDALNGWDPTYGSLYFWNPSKPVTPWIWRLNIVRQIGNHVFAR